MSNSESNLEKERLELEKLRLEITALQAPWWQKHTEALSPLLIALLALSGAWGAGWFDQKREQLTIDKRRLQAEVQTLKAERDTLTNQKVHLGSEIASLQEAVANAGRENTRLVREKAALGTALKAIKEEASQARAELARINREKLGLEKKAQIMNSEINVARATLDSQRDKATKIAAMSGLAIEKLDSLFTTGALRNLRPEIRPPEVEDPAYRSVTRTTAEVRLIIRDMKRIAEN